MTYADDLVILCRRGKAAEALQRLREIMGKLKLTVILSSRPARPTWRAVRLPSVMMARRCPVGLWCIRSWQPPVALMVIAIVQSRAGRPRGGDQLS